MTVLELYFLEYILIYMGKAKAAIFIPNSAAAIHAPQLKHEIRNCGCTISNIAVYTDLKSLMADARAHRFDVLFLNYTQLHEAERSAAREAVNRLYTLGRSVIVC